MQLKLRYPLKDVFVTQSFGKNATEVYAGLGMKGHSGIDFRAPDGTPVLASHDGRVTYAGYDGSGGLTIVIRTEEQFEDVNGNPTYWKTIYCHLKKNTLKVTGGQSVKVGQVIAEADNTGLSTGSHLHFGLKPIYKGEEDWQWMNSEQGNGYYGAIDPQPYFDTKFVPFKKPIKFGQKGDDVEALQAFLIRKGFLKVPLGVPLGYYGTLTQEAVKNFQISKGITHNNGIQAGPLTIQSINQDYDI